MNEDNDPSDDPSPEDILYAKQLLVMEHFSMTYAQATTLVDRLKHNQPCPGLKASDAVALLIYLHSSDFYREALERARDNAS